VANRLVRHGMAFRTAHHLVGEAVRTAIEAGSTDLAAFGPPGWLEGIGLTSLDPAELARAAEHGGGPGAFGPPFEQAAAAWTAHRNWHRRWRESLRLADAELADAVARWAEA
jgi:argininosuccinate lyase